MWISYQLAFLTPGMLPSRAFSRNGYCDVRQRRSRAPAQLSLSQPYPRHVEISQYASPSPTHDASVPYLRRSGVAVHL